MAITTLSGLKDGLQPPFYFFKSSVSSEGAGILISTFYVAGNPAAAAAPTPGIDGEALTSYAGQIPWSNPASGNGYIGAIKATSATGITANLGAMWLLDRLWHNSDISATTTTEQAISSPAWPARDRGGSTNGDGVFVALEVSASMGNAGAVTNTTLNYTNSAGTSGRTGTITSVPLTLAIHTFVPFYLQAGDVGVRSVQGLTLGTSYVSGTMHLVAFRPICDWHMEQSLARQVPVSPLSLAMPRVYDSSVPFLIIVNGTSTTGTHMHTLTAAHG